jgi:cytochrome c-type biogenesis protein CcmH/NrfG
MGTTGRPETPVKRSFPRLLWQAALIAAAAVLPFLPGLQSPLLFDDVNTVIQNPAVRSINLDRFFADPSAFSVKPGNWPYRPLTVAANSILFRIANVHPLPWHAFQLMVHFLNSLLLMIAARRAFGLTRGALMAGLLFAVAPLQTQAVLYVSAKSMVLAAAPALVSVIAMVEAARAKAERDVLLWTGACVFCAALAFFTSEGSLSLLFFLPLGLWASGAGLKKKIAWKTFAAVAALAAIYLLVRSLLASAGPAAERMAPPFTSVQNAALQLSFPWVMVRLFLFPFHLSFMHHAGAPQGITDPLFWAPLAGAMAAAALIVALHRKRATAAGLAWYFAALLPAVIVPLNIAWAEHRSYLAVPGLAVAIGFAAEKIISAQAGKGRMIFSRLCVAVVILMLAALTWERSRQWSSPLELFRDAVRNAPEYDVPWNFLADEQRQRLEFKSALVSLDRTIAINPSFADAYNSRAAILMTFQKFEAAADSARMAVELDPQNGTYWNSFATALMNMKKFKEAEAPLKKALELSPADDPNRPVFERNWQALQEKLK